MEIGIDLSHPWTGYVVTFLAALPLLYLVRQLILPVILWVGEAVLYTAALHLLLHGVVRTARWFKLESTMYVNERADPGWYVPIAEFWNPALYNPDWLFYFQIAALCVITFLVLKHRPLKFQSKPVRAPFNRDSLDFSPRKTVRR